jgi:enoyl-CoA hydratase
MSRTTRRAATALVRSDRLSLLAQWGMPERDAMANELGSISRVAVEAMEGSHRFAAGADRRGAPV